MCGYLGCKTMGNLGTAKGKRNCNTDALQCGHIKLNRNNDNNNNKILMYGSAGTFLKCININ